ncbi:hypothetical protein AKJ16_DCAP26161 [Drosera capensis]
MAQKAVLKVLTRTDDRTKQKAIEAAADIFGLYFLLSYVILELGYHQKIVSVLSGFDSGGSERAEADSDRSMDAVAVVKKLKKACKMVDPVSVGAAQEEKKEEKKEEKNEETKEEKKNEKKECWKMKTTVKNVCDALYDLLELLYFW